MNNILLKLTSSMYIGYLCSCENWKYWNNDERLNNWGLMSIISRLKKLIYLKYNSKSNSSHITFTNKKGWEYTNDNNTNYIVFYHYQK